MPITGLTPYDDDLETLGQGAQSGTARPTPPPIAPAPATVTSAAPTPANPYLSIMQSEDRQLETGLRKSVVDTAHMDPARAAEVQRISERTGLPASVVERNYDAAKQRARVIDTPFAQILRESPATASLLNDPNLPHIGAAVWDDLAPLGFLEWLVKAPARSWMAGAASTRAAELHYASIYRPLTADEQHQLAADEQTAAQAGPMGTEGSWFRGAITGAAGALPILLGAEAEGFKMAVPAGIATAVGAAILGVAGPQVVAAPITEPIGVPAAFTAGFGAGNMVGVANYMTRISAGDAMREYATFRDELGRPLDINAARGAALATGVINGGLQSVGLGYLLRAFPGLGGLSGTATTAAVKQALRQPSVRAALADAVKAGGKNLTAATAIQVASRAVTILGGELTKAAAPPANVPGMVAPGNVNLYAQPSIQNADGTVSTVDSVSIAVDGHEVLLPRVTPDGRHLTTEQAIAEYQHTGLNLGTFDTKESATAFAEQLHQEYAAGRYATGAKYRTLDDIAADLGHTATSSAQAFALISALGPAKGLAGDLVRAERAKGNAAFFTALGEGVTQSKTYARLPGALQALVERATKDGPVETLYAPIDTWTTYWQSRNIDPKEVATAVTGDSLAYDRAVRDNADLQIPTSRYAVKLAGTEHNAYFAHELRLGPEEMNWRESTAYREELAARRAAVEATPPEQRSAVYHDTRAQLLAAGMDPRTAETKAVLNEAVFSSFADRAQLEGVTAEALYGRLGLKVTRETAPGAPEGRPAAPAGARTTSGAPTSAAPGLPLEAPRAGAGDALRPAGGPAGPGGPVQGGTEAGLPTDLPTGMSTHVSGLPAGTAFLRTWKGETILATRSPGEGGEKWTIDALDLGTGRRRHLFSEGWRFLHEDTAPLRSDPVGDAARAATGDVGGATLSGGGEASDANARGRAGVPGGAPEPVAPLEGGVPARGSEAPGTPEGRALEVPDSQRDHAEQLLAGARARGFTGSDAEFVTLYKEARQKAVDTIRDLKDFEAAEESSHLDLLKAVSQVGGIGLEEEAGGANYVRGELKGRGGMVQELENLFEGLNRSTKSEAVIKRGKRAGHTVKLPKQFRRSGGLKGLPNLIVRKGGLTLDYMREHLNQTEGFIGKFENLNDFLQAFSDAVLIELGVMKPAEDSTYTVEGVMSGAFDIRPETDWWKPAGPDETALERDTNEGDTSFDPSEFNQGPPPEGDLLSTGERQPRLPGDVGDVRNQEVVQPALGTVGDDFQLTPPEETQPTQTELFQPAYHGSPHIFEQFSLHAIGSGEGHQAYGWGLYFTSTKDIAEGYRDRLAPRPTVKVDGVDMDARSHNINIFDDSVPPGTRLAGELAAQGKVWLQVHKTLPTGDELAANVDAELQRRLAYLTGAPAARLEVLRALLATWKAKGITLERGGRVYTVDIPEAGDYLDWDKPASEQSPKVQAALRALGVEWQPFKTKTLGQMRRWLAGPTAERLFREDIGIRESIHEALLLAEIGDAAGLERWQKQHQGYFNQGAVDTMGEELYRQLQFREANRDNEPARVGAERASKLLAAQGVAGIRYLDGFSRAKGEGSSNYVVFDDKLARITEYEQSPLIIQHNVTAENLRHSQRLGGFPVPSLAITKAVDAMTNFGEITLLGSKEMADPRGYARPRVFGADAYSTRYPAVHFKIPAEGERLLAHELRPYSHMVNLDYYDLDSLIKEGPKYLRNDPRVMLKFLTEDAKVATGLHNPVRVQELEAERDALIAKHPDEDGYTSPQQFKRRASKAELARYHAVMGELADAGTYDHGRDRLRARIRDLKLEPRFEAFVDTLFQSLKPTERIFKGFTDAGNRRYVPHTLENVVAEMKRGLRGGESEGNIYGAGQLRAKLTPQFSSLKAIQNARDLLVSKTAFETVKDQINGELLDIAHELVGPAPKGENPFIWNDRGINILTDAATRGLERTLREYGVDNVTDATKQRALDFFAKLRNLPTEYFEAKILRGVELSEFAGAVIPHDAPADVRAMLERAGLSIAEYDRTAGEPARKQAIEAQARALGERVLFSETPAFRRGALRFGPDRQFTIALFERADLSTFLHESGHLYLEVFGDVVDAVKSLDPATLKPGQQQLVADYDTILASLGVDKRADVGREQHEAFARSFEAYLLDGHAPSLALEGPFARFRAWLLGIYKSAQSLGVTVSPELRRVFDRMLASDAAIKDVAERARIEPMFLTADAVGMPADEFGLYRDTITRASETARAELSAKLLGEVQREQTAEWQSRRDDIEQAVTTELQARPDFQALAAMRRGTKPDGTAMVEGLETEPLKLSRQILVERFGVERLKELPAGIYSREGGLDPDTVAQMFGYSSGDELLTAVGKAGNLEDAVQAETERRMLAEHGSILLDGSLHEKAQAATANVDRETVIKMELRALGRLRRLAKPIADFHVRTAVAGERAERDYERRWFEAEAKLRVALAKGEQQVKIDALQDEVRKLRAKARGGAATIRAAIPPDAVLRSQASARIAGTRIRDLRPEAFWSASRKAAQLAVESAARQDFEGAITLKQQELLNLANFRAAMDAKADVELRVRKARDLMKNSRRSAIGLAGESYLDQVDGILDRFDFAKVSAKALDRRAALAEWIADREQEGLPVDLPDELVNEARRTPYRDLTYEQLVGVTDGLDQIVHLAQLKNRLLKSERGRQLDATVEELTAAIRSSNPAARTREEMRDRSAGAERRRIIGSFFASHRKIASLAREFDGWLDGGVWWETIIRPLNEAADREATMQHEATDKLHTLVEAAYPGGDKRRLYEAHFVESVGQSLTRMRRLMIALNWGNEGNRQRVLSSERWSESQVDGILETLTPKDLQFVQGVWDYLDRTYWAQIEAKQKRVYGIAPEKVEALPFTVGDTAMRGGYFPLKYDDRLSATAGAHLDLDAGLAAKQAAYVNATTKRGFTKARAAKVSLPLRLDFGVLTEHVQAVIHDLTHHEALLDASRILQDRRLQKAMYETYGDVTYRQFKDALRDIAFGQVPATTAFEKVLNHLRSGATIAGLGWNVSTSVVNLVGLTQSMVRIGPGWVARGLYRVTRDAASLENSGAWVDTKSEFMRNRARTQMREIAELRNTVGIDKGALAGWVDEAVSKATFDLTTRKAIADSFLWFIEKTQRLVDVPSWIGAYEKAMAGPLEGRSEAEHESRAVALADQAVIDAQGSGHVKDLAGVQRGGPLLKLWTNFYSFFSTTYNLTVESTKRTKFSSPASVAKLAGDYMLLYIVPATLGYTVRNAIRGTTPEDSKKVAEGLARENAAYLLGTMLGFRELAGAAQGYSGYEGPAGARAFSALSRLAKQSSQGEADHAFLAAANDSAGILFHYPSVQTRRTLEGLMALAEHRTRNPGALIGGVPGPRR